MNIKSVANANGSYRDYEIFLRRDGVVYPVDYCFDFDDSETFDPTEVVEVFTGLQMLSIQDGDEFVFRIVTA